jgi:hypothetical protein
MSSLVQDIKEKLRKGNTVEDNLIMDDDGIQ